MEPGAFPRPNHFQRCDYICSYNISFIFNFRTIPVTTNPQKNTRLQHQMQHRCNTDATQMQHRYNTDTTQMQHRCNTDATQIQHRCNTNASHIHLIYDLIPSLYSSGHAIFALHSHSSQTVSHNDIVDCNHYLNNDHASLASSLSLKI